MRKSLFTGSVLLLINLAAVVHAEADARVTLIEGSAQTWRKKNDQWKPLRLNMPLKADDQVKTDAETLVEITYNQGVVVRLDENTHCSIRQASKVHVSTSVSRGNIWVNMKKIASSGRSFEVSTPTAVAAIRGTVFELQSRSDSTTDVAVFDGKVAVGLSIAGKKRVEAEKASFPEPHEVPGPHEIPGPYEVTLDQWREVVAGQRITVLKNGRFAVSDFSPEKEDAAAFVKKNRALDAYIEGAR